MTLVDAPKHLRLWCRKCNATHLFHLRGDKFYGDCYEQAIPESLLNQALGFEITVLTLLAQFSSQMEWGVEELVLPHTACVVRPCYHEQGWRLPDEVFA